MAGSFAQCLRVVVLAEEAEGESGERAASEAECLGRATGASFELFPVVEAVVLVVVDELVSHGGEVAEVFQGLRWELCRDGVEPFVEAAAGGVEPSLEVGLEAFGPFDSSFEVGGHGSGLP